MTRSGGPISAKTPSSTTLRMVWACDWGTPAASLFRSPRHPYTYGLLNSFPPMHGERKAMTGIAGSPPDLRSIPSGCAFHPRCLHAMDRCSAEVPQLVPLSTGPAPAGRSRREVACWLHDPQSPVPVPEELARPDPADPAPLAADPAATQEGTS